MRLIPFLIVGLFFGQAFAQTDAPKEPEKKYESEVVPYRIYPEWKFALGLGFSLSSKLKFDNGHVTSSGNSSSLTADMDYKNAAILDFEGRYMAANSWGVILGLQVDGERDFDKGSVTSGGITYTSSGVDSGGKIQVTNVFGSAVYRWDQFYIPVGLNASAVKFTPPSGSTGSYDASGGIGAQVGVGFLANEHLAFELNSRAIAVKLKVTTASGTADYGTGYLSSLTVMGKYIF